MFNNPYFYSMPIKSSLTKGLFSNINWTNILTNTSKTLGVINQAIPIVYQVKPIFQNARTMFKIADQIQKPTTVNLDTNTVKETNPTNKPIFYL